MSDRLDNWLRQTETLVGPLTVKVAGYDVEVELTPPALERVFLPVLDLLHDRGPGRVIAGLAGIPGGGKSTFAAVLQNPELFSGKRVGVVLSGGNVAPEVVRLAGDAP